MIYILAAAGAILALAVGIWIGIGAPGWPVPPTYERGRLEKREINPIAWGRSSNRQRLGRRGREDRHRR